MLDLLHFELTTYNFSLVLAYVCVGEQTGNLAAHYANTSRGADGAAGEFKIKGQGTGDPFTPTTCGYLKPLFLHQFNVLDLRAVKHQTQAALDRPVVKYVVQGFLALCFSLLNLGTPFSTGPCPYTGDKLLQQGAPWQPHIYQHSARHHLLNPHSPAFLRRLSPGTTQTS